MSTILYDDGNHKCIKFDNLTEGGEIQSNQFLIIHNRRELLIDCGGYRIYQNLLGALSRHLPAGSLDYIFLSHQDPDIGSGLNLWLPICKAQIMISALWLRFIPAFCVRGLSETRTTAIPDHGMRFSLAGCDLFAIPGHFLHSPGNFHLYDPLSKILFTGDLGASIEPISENIQTESEFTEHIGSMAGFHNRYIASNMACRRWAEMVRPLDVEMIVPQHGARISGKALVDTFYDWVASEKTAVDSFSDNLYQLPEGLVKVS
jgi:flavorubredoxin